MPNRAMLLWLLIWCAPAWGQFADVRPDPDGEITEIRVHIVVADIDSIDTVNQTFSANLFYQLRWSDPRLAHDGEALIHKPMSEVWRPVLQLVNLQHVWKRLPVMFVTLCVAPALV